jgi:hypothetical protein
MRINIRSSVKLFINRFCLLLNFFVGIFYASSDIVSPKDKTDDHHQDRNVQHIVVIQKDTVGSCLRIIRGFDKTGVVSRPFHTPGVTPTTGETRPKLPYGEAEPQFSPKDMNFSINDSYSHSPYDEHCEAKSGKDGATVNLSQR